MSDNYDLERYTKIMYDIQIIKQCLFPPECLFFVNNHKKYNINNIEESEKLYGIYMNYYKNKNEEKENLIKLKSNYPNLMKDKDFFVSLIQQ